jgi:hypothetical protein
MIQIAKEINFKNSARLGLLFGVTRMHLNVINLTLTHNEVLGTSKYIYT